MSNQAKFTLAFNLVPTNEERIRMFELYREAFGARKLSESTPPGSDELHMMIELCGTEILLGPGDGKGEGLQNPIVCEVRFREKAEFDKAYETLKATGQSAVLEGPYPWADRLGLVTDQFGVGWALYYNR